MATSTGPARETAGASNPTPIRNYIGGAWVTAEASEHLPVLNPATGEQLGQVPSSTPGEVGRAVAAAAAAFPAWRATPPLERAQFMFRLKELMEQQFEDIARTITLEHGKVLEDSRGSVRRAIENVEVAAGIPSLMMGYGLEDGASRGIDEEVVRQPLGVFAAICPFNFPAMVPFWFWPYAVACGNTFVVKPSEQVPLTMQRIFELIQAADFPSGVINLVHGHRPAVDALLDHPDIRGISFVGSSPVAAHVYQRAASHGKRVQAQGGAKNVLVTLPDANLDMAIPNIIGSAFGSSGQRCLAGSLLVTVGGGQAVVRDRVRDAAARLVVGNGLDPDVEMGPVISAPARERIVAAISAAEADGASLVLDGRQVRVPQHPQGFYVGATLFDNVAPEMRLAQEEIFGPVLGMIAVDTLDEAISLINQSRYGNAASIFTESGKAARQFRYEVQCGNIGVNVGVAAPMAYFPFSGMKGSFYGTQHGQGRDAIDFFTERKVVITRWF